MTFFTNLWSPILKRSLKLYCAMDSQIALYQSPISVQAPLTVTLGCLLKDSNLLLSRCWNPNYRTFHQKLLGLMLNQEQSQKVNALHTLTAITLQIDTIIGWSNANAIGIIRMLFYSYWISSNDNHSSGDTHFSPYGKCHFNKTNI